MKNALVISYSQAGQTKRAVEVVLGGLSGSLNCDHVELVSKEVFPFPWKMRSFFAVFPRCFFGPLPKLEPLPINWGKYDLVILAYQVWFLAPSLPIQAFLDSPESAEGLKDKKVISVITCRNLYHSAVNVVRRKLAKIQCQPLGELILCETSPLWASFVTTPRWMLTGRKDRFAIFPAAGIGEEVFKEFERKIHVLAECFRTKGLPPDSFWGSNLSRASLKMMEQVGLPLFHLWAKIISSLAPRQGLIQDSLLVLFRLNLIALILVLVPCTKLAELFLSIRGDKH